MATRAGSIAWGPQGYELRAAHRTDYSVGQQPDRAAISSAICRQAVSAHITRLRMAGKFRKPLEELKSSLIEAAEALSDVRPAIIVFHCTANSMENGLAARGRDR